MSSRRNFAAWTAIGLLLSLALPLAGTAIAELFFPDLRWIHLPVHSLVEGAGGLIALAIGGILLTEIGHKKNAQHYPVMAAGFASMGVLDVFHAASAPGNEFVWLHSAATFAGGFFFGLVWLGRKLPPFFSGRKFQILVTVVSCLIGGLSVIETGALPAMRTSDGAFSNAAMFLNLAGGVGFLIASAFLIRRFLVIGETEDWLFAVQTTLFGAAGILFRYSILWDGGWWWWHALRLAAYVAALTYGLRTFRAAEKELRRVNQKLSDSNVTLDLEIEKRTASLQASEERFELAVRGSTDGIWDWCVPTGEVYYSPRMKELMGYLDHEFPNTFDAFETHLHPDDHDWVLREIQEHLQQQKPYDVEYRLQTKSAGYRWFRARGQAIWNEANEPQRMAGSITDVTEQHRLREWFRKAVEASPAALIMVHQDGRILMANSLSLSMFGYSNDELIGQPIEVLVPERYRADHSTHRNQFFRNPAQRAMEAQLVLVGVRKDGTDFPVKVGLSPVEIAEGTAVICGILDITDQINALDAMQRAKESAESASRAKSSFLANMSHEIRTPMNGIIGMAQLLSQTELRSHQRDYLATVDESAHILLRLLNDILDFSKIEAGKLELEYVDFRISECVARATQMLVLRAAEKGLEVACRIAPGIPDYLYGDPGRIQQVLVNLIGNAVKFTESGEIFLNVDTDPESTNTDHVKLHFSVKDTGIGIPPEKQEQIFRPFEQAESETTRRFGGTGLGLAISQQLVEMMHGRMWVESQPDQGSTFHFTAEFEVSANQHEHLPAELSSLNNLPVLVVDDNYTNRRILSEMLQYWHMQPTLADSAATARRALQKAQEELHPIRLILLDHHMPIEDGFHFAESVLDLVKTAQCRIIMISSGSSPVDADMCEKHGISRFMTKPVIASELLNEVLRQFGQHIEVSEDRPTIASTVPRVHPRRVLLVEDNEINRRVALGLLRSRGHQAVVAVNGQEAVDTLATQEFDVVLMDMQMPVMDGYEATTEIRKRERQTGGHIPIVAMTAEALKGDRERCIETGMDEYVSKPISAAAMYRAIEKFPAVCLPADFGHRNLKESSQPQTQNISTTATKEVSSALPDAKNRSEKLEPVTVEVIDWNVAKKLLGDDDAVLTEFSDLLKSEAPLRMAEIRNAIEQLDAKLLRRAAHTLKGSCSYFGAKPVIQAALALEELGTSESFDGSDELLETLERDLAQLLAALDAGPPMKNGSD